MSSMSTTSLESTESSESPVTVIPQWMPHVYNPYLFSSESSFSSWATWELYGSDLSSWMYNWDLPPSSSDGTSSMQQMIPVIPAEVIPPVLNLPPVPTVPPPTTPIQVYQRRAKRSPQIPTEVSLNKRNKVVRDFDLNLPPKPEDEAGPSHVNDDTSDMVNSSEGSN